ncbi:MAG: Pantoate--beta-alanine ligase / Cytidylate kinase, partial [Cyanobacteriota bacterium]
TWERDCQFAESLGVTVIFAPTLQTLGLAVVGNDQSRSTTVMPPVSMTNVLCGVYRPGHFQGVATIVTKLFTIVCPDVAYFGEKDAQQVAIIRRLVSDLHLTVAIRCCPIVREPSGLALSSRNQYLSESQQQEAGVLFQSLQRAVAVYQQGERHAETLINTAKNILATVPTVKLQYLELVEAVTLTPITADLPDHTPALLAIAAYVGDTRLIDNVMLNMRQPIIAIDGPAGAGKSTVTRQVADRLGLTYLDTGAMYRAIAWLTWEQNIDPHDHAAVAEQTSQAEIELISRPAPQLTGVKVNGLDVSEAIRTPAVTQRVATIAAQGAVRQTLLNLQRAYGKQGGIVAEGRDIGTHVFPDADLKIFLTASVAERARRRWQDFQAQGKTDITLNALEAEIAQRDHLDSTRAIAPLKRAADAIEVVTDGLTIDQVIEKIITLYRSV